MSRIARRNIVPVNQITPLTYRDGVTYIQMLNELSEYVKSILHPSLQHTVDQLVSDVEKQMDKHHDQYVDGVQEFQRIHDAFMSDVNARLIALNDGAATDLVNDDTSLLGKALRSIFTTPESLDGDMMTVIGDQLSAVRRELDRRSAVYPRFFGAVGDGVVDDTQAMRRWAASEYTQLEPGATYYITDGIQLTKSVDGNGATIILDSNDSDTGYGVWVTGDHKHVTNLTVIGRGYNRCGIRVQGDYARVEGCSVYDIWSDWWSRGIEVETNMGGAHIVNNITSNMWAKGNQNTGDAIGAARGIYLHGTVAGVMHPSMVIGNHVDEVRGEEGDGIQLIFYKPDGTNPFGNGNVTVLNNVVEDSSRRMLKVQCSNVDIIGNQFSQTRVRNPQIHGTEIAAWGVGIVQSENVRVLNNTITWVDMEGALTFGGDADSRYKGIVFKNNSIQAAPRTTGFGIYFDRLDNAVISENRIHGGSMGIVGGTSTTVSIVNNVLGDIDTPTDRGFHRTIHTNSTVEHGVIVGNLIYGSRGANDITNWALKRTTERNLRV